MRKYAPILIIVFVILGINGCYYDKAEVLFPPEAKCEVANVKYSTDVLPVLTTYCKNCHSTGSFNAGAKNQWTIENFTSFQTKALNGSVVDRITRDASAPGHMPQGGPKLDTCTISKIIAWKNKGALQN